MSRRPMSLGSADELPAATTRYRPASILSGSTSGAALFFLVLALLCSRTPPPLPACQAPATRTALADTLDRIPALSGKHARLIALEQVSTRGHKGRHPMRACQAWLVTSQGSGMLEFSINQTSEQVPAWRVQPELFQGGWHDSLAEGHRASAAHPVARPAERSGSRTKALASRYN